MERKLHLLDSFTARAADGSLRKVLGYEHLVRDDASTQLEAWEPTGQVEYRLAEGERVTLEADGTLRVAGSGEALERVDGRPDGASAESGAQAQAA